MAALFPFRGVDNKVIEAKLSSILETKLDVSKYFTTDYSLESEPGMVKLIRTYAGSGAAEDLARGEGLADYIDAEYTEKEYRVGRTQVGAYSF